MSSNKIRNNTSNNNHKSSTKLRSKPVMSASAHNHNQNSTSLVTISSPTAYGTIVKPRRPSFNQGQNGSLIVNHVERVNATIQSNATPNSSLLGTRSVNPVSDVMFPWLAPVAFGFERFKFTKLKFHYIPNLPTSTPGVFALAVDPNRADGDPAGIEEVTEMRVSSTGPVWQNLTIELPKDVLDRQKWWFTNTIQDVANTEGNAFATYLGRLIFISAGVSTASLNLGSIYVDYAIELIDTQKNKYAYSMIFSTIASSPDQLPFGGMTAVGTNYNGSFGRGNLDPATNYSTYSTNSIYLPSAGSFFIMRSYTGTGYTGIGTIVAVYNKYGVNITSTGYNVLVNYARDTSGARAMIIEVVTTYESETRVQFANNTCTTCNSVLCSIMPQGVPQQSDSTVIRSASRLIQSQISQQISTPSDIICPPNSPIRDDYVSVCENQQIPRKK
jgi:hypothetical protein